MPDKVPFDWSCGVLRGYRVLQRLPVVTNPFCTPKFTRERVHVGATYGGGYERQSYRNLTW